MSDERERRYRARIDLATGRASVTETHPVDRRTAATVPPLQRPPQARAEPPREGVQEGAPAPGPIFPWARAPETSLPQPQDASRRGQPEIHIPPAVDSQMIPWSGDEPPPPPSADQLAQAFAPGPSAVELAKEDELLERIAATVVARLCTMLGMRPEEPPVPLIEMATDVEFGSMFEIHPAGSFVNEREPEPTFDPAGSFVHDP